HGVGGLGAARSAAPGAVDRLRPLAESTAAAPTPDADESAPPWAVPAAGRGRPGNRRTAAAIVLASTDPANPYGAALPWPDRVVDEGSTAGSTSGGHRAGRKAGALVVLVDGGLVLYVERGGATLLSYVDDPDTLTRAAKALADAVHAGALGTLSVERAD